MTQIQSKQRFIPFQKTDVITLCCQDGSLSEPDINEFKLVCDLINSLFHFQFQRNLEALKHYYSPVNPDADTQTLFPVSEAEKQQREAHLITKLKALLDAANFEEITRLILIAHCSKNPYLKFDSKLTLMTLNTFYFSVVAYQLNKRPLLNGLAYQKKTSSSKTMNVSLSTSNTKTSPTSTNKGAKTYSSHLAQPSSKYSKTYQVPT